MGLTKVVTIFLHALVGWGLCGAVIAVGRNTTSMENTLLIHAAAVPLIFGAVSLVYFTRFNYTTPLQTAGIFLFFAILMDGGVIAPFAEKSFAMFASLLGTWIPFGLIFTVTCLTGRIVLRSTKSPACSTLHNG
jgi:hypothetical protein